MTTWFNRAPTLTGWITLIATVLMPTCLLAMQSSSYQITNDTVDSAGAFSTSTTYTIQDSVAQPQSGTTSSANYGVNAGFQQIDDVTISLSAPSPITLDPLSLTLNSAVGTATWTVTTNDTAGYTLTLNASQVNALSNGVSNFSDYSSIPTIWSVTNAYKFGFTAYGPDTTGFGSTTGDCTNGTADTPQTTLLWRGFNGTTAIQVASSSSQTPSGTVTTMCIADAQNGLLAPSGSYSATITATATAL